jgi:hypothetical protein
VVARSLRHAVYPSSESVAPTSIARFVGTSVLEQVRCCDGSAVDVGTVRVVVEAGRQR